MNIDPTHKYSAARYRRLVRTLARQKIATALFASLCSLSRKEILKCRIPLGAIKVLPKGISGTEATQQDLLLCLWKKGLTVDLKTGGKVTANSRKRVVAVCLKTNEEIDPLFAQFAVNKGLSPDLRKKFEPLSSEYYEKAIRDGHSDNVLLFLAKDYCQIPEFTGRLFSGWLND